MLSKTRIKIQRKTYFSHLENLAESESLGFYIWNKLKITTKLKPQVNQYGYLEVNGVPSKSSGNRKLLSNYRASLAQVFKSYGHKRMKI